MQCPVVMCVGRGLRGSVTSVPETRVVRVHCVATYHAETVGHGVDGGAGQRQHGGGGQGRDVGGCGVHLGACKVCRHVVSYCVLGPHIHHLTQEHTTLAGSGQSNVALLHGVLVERVQLCLQALAVHVQVDDKVSD